MEINELLKFCLNIKFCIALGPLLSIWIYGGYSLEKLEQNNRIWTINLATWQMTHSYKWVTISTKIIESVSRVLFNRLILIDQWVDGYTNESLLTRVKAAQLHLTSNHLLKINKFPEKSWNLEISSARMIVGTTCSIYPLAVLVKAVLQNLKKNPLSQFW